MKIKIIQKSIFSVFSVLLMSFGFSSIANASGSLSIDGTLNGLSESSSAVQGFTVKLTPEPVDLVTTAFSTNGQCKLSANENEFTTGGSVITKNDSLQFRLQVIDDQLHEGSHTCKLTFKSSSTTDSNYTSERTFSKTVSVNDDDQNSTYAFTTQKLSTAQLVENDTFVERYLIGLTKAARYDIVVTALADDQCDLLSGAEPNQSRTKSITRTIKKGSISSIEFSAIPVNDAVFEGQHQCTIQHSVATADFDYKNITIPARTIFIQDDETNKNIPDQREYEGGLIYYKDANADDIDDVDQPQVTSFINIITGKRQGLIIVDSSGKIASDCTINGEAQSSKLPPSARLASEMGELSFDLECSGEGEKFALWLLDSYYVGSNTWLVYGYNSETELVQLDARNEFFTIGDDFVSALKVKLDGEDGRVRFVQSSELKASQQLDQEITPTVAASDEKPIFLIGIILVGVGVVGYVIYRRYFAYIDTRTKSSYPRVDKY